MGLQMTWQQLSSHHGKGRSGPPLGLRNLGNTCYLNSVLQCLTYTPPLTQFCLSSSHSSLCKSMTANREKECPFCILERQIARLLSIGGPMDAPLKISKSIMLYAEHFRWGRQEDAHEFLRYVIDVCHNTCLKIINKINGMKDQGEMSTTVMKEIFGGSLLSQVKCLGCKGESNKTDEIMDISLDVFQSNSLKDALGKFFQPEILDGNNKYSCSNCKKLHVAKKQMFVQHAPNVLVIQLKRFEGIHGGKINRNIEFEEVLAFSKYMYIGSKVQDPQPEYSLFGSIVHSGYSPESGHYYAYIKDAYGRWYCCNDTHVSLSSTQQVLSEKVYILFYIRSNESPRTGKCGSLSMTKSSELVEINASICQKSADPAKRPILKANVTLSSQNSSSVILKNGKTPSYLQIKPFRLTSFEPRRVVSNGNGDIGVHNNSWSERQEPRRVVSNGNGDIGVHNNSLSERQDCLIQSHNGKENEIVQAKGNKESKGANEVENLSSPHGSAANGTSTLSILENNVNEHCNKLETGERNSVEAVRVEADCIHTSSKETRKRNPGNASSKRKVCDSEMMDSGDISCKGSHILYGFVQPTKANGRSNGKHNKEELQDLKKVLVEVTSSGLRSSGWVESVHSFMKDRKRLLCSQASGSVCDISDLKNQLINDARKTFTSQIPESLKGHLVERLDRFVRASYTDS